MGLLDDKSFIVTGAGSGIGEATTRRIAREGGNVIALDLAESVMTLEALPRVRPMRMDVSVKENLQRAVQEAQADFGRLDGAVAAAGITRAGTVDTMGLEDWASVLHVNLTSVFLLAQATFPAFRTNSGGSFVAIASQVGLVGYPENVAYCAAKGGVVNLIRAMAVDASHEGIRSNTICPGPIDTPMLRQGFAQTGENLEIATKRVPAGRVGTADEIAATTCFLLSDQARFVTGAAWTVDGGYTAQ